jgi:methylthioribose-1-phosphate isomerase
MRTVEWDSTKNCIRMIDQRLLPGRFVQVEFTDYQQAANSIRDMVVRGAPAIGATAAFALALAARQSKADSINAFKNEIESASRVILNARPTAVNLAWAVSRLLTKMQESKAQDPGQIKEVLLLEAQRIAEEDIETNLRMAEHGAKLIDDGDTIIHHCNTGALATVDWGTALGVIRLAHEQGKRVRVLVDETRPRLQGARLTAWELERYGIPYDIISDNAAGYFLRNGAVQKVFFGADRIAANGDVANKIGTYMLSLAAFDNHVPAFCVAPVSTIDYELANGSLIPIEERSMDEVLNIQAGGEAIAPKGATARNPAFDVTPNRLIRGIVTEKCVVYPPFEKGLKEIHKL